MLRTTGYHVVKGHVTEILERSRPLTAAETKEMKIRDLKRRLQACRDSRVMDWMMDYLDFLQRRVG